MKRRELLAAILATASLAGPASAQDYVASVIAQLRKQKFRSVVEERTLLGRVRITATRSDGRREIIINPGNGEILRDLWTPSASGSTTIDIIEDKSGRGGGNDDDDDEGGDDGGDDGGGDDEGGDDEGGDDDSGGGGGDDDDD